MDTLPVVRPLPPEFSLSEAFHCCAGLPHCIWFDSAAPGPETERGPIGRYSYLTADPVETLTAAIGDPDPWARMRRWAAALPARPEDQLPPFQGGIAGMIGYEAAHWLEPVPLSAIDDFPLPVVSLGLYDWVLAVDHLERRGWLISQGFGAADPHRRASARAEEVLAMLSQSDRFVPEPWAGPGEEGQRLGYAETHRAGVWSNFTGPQFRDAVAEIVRRICRGDSFQVNLAQRLLTAATCSPPDLYRRLRRASPAPYGAYYRLGPAKTAGQRLQEGGLAPRGEAAVLSSSMEALLRIRGTQVETRPIKGTVPRTGSPGRDRQLAAALLASDKDRAENTMIVDLMRNDLSRVCADESVRVGQLCGLETYRQVQHLVSVVTGQLLPGKTAVDALQACFPGGSITGAPKIEAMRTIAELEPHRRGAYCGSLGYISSGNQAEFNILIRTITAAGGYWQIPVGGGITARSDPASEEAETWAKAAGMLRAALGD